MINNIMTVMDMLGILAIAIISNTVLGVVVANKKTKFNKKTLLKGLGKALLIALCMLSICVTLELVPTILARIGIDVSSELITVVEVALITFTAYKKYALDCIDKFKTILNIKESD